MKIALVYDWLIHIGGGERTLAALTEVIPAPIYTLVADRERLKGTPFESMDIHTSFLQGFPLVKEHYRYYLPFFTRAIESINLSEYDCILSLSHAVAKGVITHPHQLHMCYCFTPMRYAWDLSECYMQGLNPIKRVLAQPVLRKLRQWDIASLDRVDFFTGISQHVAQRIKRIYGRDAEVIYPPVDTDAIALETKKEDYFLTVSRIVPYKKIDLIVETFTEWADKKLIVIGEGPELDNIKKKAGKNIEILGHQSDSIVSEYLRKARGFVFAGEEDFGIAPVEAQAAGTPVIAFGKGGAMETIDSEKTGIFFDEQTVPSMMQALKRFEKMQWDPEKIRENALRFSKDKFQKNIQMFVNQKIEAFHESSHLSRR